MPSVNKNTPADLQAIVEEIDITIDFQGDWNLGQFDSDVDLFLSTIRERLENLIIQYEAELLIDERSSDVAG